ncbi:hypothetical protein M233_03240 [Xylella fastidiosa subsp. multiplex Griffin-1]|nr:hypothetical protein M233_03240 [Xylella fastidiosa subsp. multiplex Griffin-1]
MRIVIVVIIGISIKEPYAEIQGESLFFNGKYADDDYVVAEIVFRSKYIYLLCFT